MKNCYRFYKNDQCEYFPCHKTKNIEGFNCMFCYCPLYFIEDCGGNHVYKDNIKVCTDCMLPHNINGYDYIINKIIEINNKKKKK